LDVFVEKVFVEKVESVRHIASCVFIMTSTTPKKLELILRRLDKIGANPAIVDTFDNVLALLKQNTKLIASLTSTNKQTTLQDVDTNLTMVVDSVKQLLASNVALSTGNALAPSTAEEPAKKKRRKT
jgi:hypothetical protein